MTDPINAVLAGCGSISRAWLDAVRAIPDIRMAGFVDIREEAVRARYETFPIYYQPEVRQVIGNAVRWAAPVRTAGFREMSETPNVPEPLEPIPA